MAVTIDSTVGGASTNSYVTLAVADTYLEGRLNVDLWDAATDDSKNRALVEAFRELNSYSWYGERTSSSQAAQWPRQWVQNPDNPNGWYYDSAEIPQRVKDAQVELANEFIKSGTSDLATADLEAGLIENTIDVITKRWDSHAKATGMRRFPRIQRLLSPLLCGARAGGISLVRG